MRRCILDKAVKCGVPVLNRSREIQFRVDRASYGTFDGFSKYNFRPEVASDVIYGVAVVDASLDVPFFRISRSY